ncbi:MAG: hypothetical protein ACRDQ4_24515 [Pseudonocardiaceae bacterium]
MTVDVGALAVDRVWKVADEVCRAEGDLVVEYSVLVDAERDYRGCWRAHQRQARQAAAQADVDVLRASPASSDAAWVGTMGVCTVRWLRSSCGRW